ncbi:hypothetical protein [Methylobacterium indicum]|uniref:Uncharacterized protein n=1 Tax=Methylobacterium indicum TaxID=1775910 RepID=A0A8H9CA78_9HYPH|nr:hypothetical protein [Methylobacterium indicum]BCM87861.1 hypothetical protein mvi_63220 [Methylobacterium indicum]
MIGGTFLGLMGNHLLDLLGIVWIVSFAVKAAKGYPFLRWFW